MDYNGAPLDGSSWEDSNGTTQRVLRGGSWNSIPKLLRSANRYGYSPDIRDYDGTGFRIARTL